MARSTGPILAVGAISLVNQSVFNDEPVDWRIVIATGIAASVLGLVEKGWERGAVAFSYLALIGILFVRMDPDQPSPVENALRWWNNPGKALGR